MAIFSAAFLKQYLEDFDAGKVVDFYGRKEVLRRWMDSMESGRIGEEKEIAIKSTFVNDFFGKVLGYSYGNSTNWLLQQEQKSFTDGTRCDAAFGYFGMEAGKIGAQVKMVAEFKGSTADLDAVQKERAVKISAVDQAFLYASKTPGDCHWVVVCNVREIRFYHYSSQALFQSYQLAELLSDERLLELIFLFQAESLLSRESSSRTDKLFELSRKVDPAAVITRARHVVDEMYELINQFEGLAFVDPVFLANQYPFNALGQLVWHYGSGVMHTTNPAIYRLLRGVQVVGGQVVIAADLEEEFLLEGLSGAADKLLHIFGRLNECLIFNLTAVEDIEEVMRTNGKGFSITHFSGYSQDYGIHRYIGIADESDCDCISCLFRTFDFKGVLERLKSVHPGNRELDYVFGRYLLRSGNDNTVYYDLEALEKKYRGLDSRIAEYMTVKLNLKYLTSEIDSSTEKGREIKVRLESMDLDGVIAYEVDLFAPAQLRRYLVEMKDEVLQERIKYKVAYSLSQTKRIMQDFLAGSHVEANDQLHVLEYCSYTLHLYSQGNFLMIEQSGAFRDIYKDIFQAYLYSFLTPDFGLTEFDERMLTDAVLHIHPATLDMMLKDIRLLAVSQQTREAMLMKARNLLLSHVASGGFGGLRADPVMQAQMLDLQSQFAHFELFSSLFIIISKIGCSVTDIRGIARNLIDFLIVNDGKNDLNMKSLQQLIIDYGDAFSPAQFLEVLEVIVPQMEVGWRKHERIFKGMCRSWRLHFSKEKLSSSKLVRQAVVNHMDGSNPDYLRLAMLWHIVTPELQGVIVAEFERFLDKSFNAWLFEALVHQGVLAFDHNGYFILFVKAQLRSNSPGGIYALKGREFPNFAIHNLAAIVHFCDVPNHHPALMLLDGLTPFQMWQMNPLEFDYSDFEVMWLKEFPSSKFLRKLKGKREVVSAVEASLREQFDVELAKLYFEYLL